MATAQQLVTRAFRRLGAIDIAEEPSDTEMTHGLAVFSEVLNGWASLGIPTEDQTIVADVTDDDDVIDGLQDPYNTDRLGIGLNVAGTGIPASATVKDVLSRTAFKLSADPTATGSDITLTIAFLPMPVRYEGAAVALLAVRLSEDLGLPVSAKLQKDAEDGWHAILSGYLPDRLTEFDPALSNRMSSYDFESNVSS